MPVDGRLTRIPCAILIVALLANACATRRPAVVPGTAAEPRLPATLRVKLAPDGAVRRVPLEDYVRGAVLAELVPPPADQSLAARALEMQAIVTRTFAVAHLERHRREGYDLCSTTHCQLYDPGRLSTSSWARTASRAVTRTAGQVLWYGKTAASAVFHADCGGHTSAADDIWGSPGHPYLAAIRDGGPARAAHRRWRFDVRGENLVAALDADPRTRVGGTLSGIRVMQRDRGGRAVLVLLRGAREPLVRGEELRAVLTRAFGAGAIRSTRFEIRRTSSSFVFTGEGFGHGVGLCQAGALARLRAGATPEEVLATYYPGTTLRRLR